MGKTVETIMTRLGDVEGKVKENNFSSIQPQVKHIEQPRTDREEKKYG